MLWGNEKTLLPEAEPENIFPRNNGTLSENQNDMVAVTVST